MISPVNDVGRAYERMMRHRRILLATHVVLGLLSGFTLMSQVDFSHYRYWGRVGTSVVAPYLIASWPYLISGLICYRREGISARGLLVLEAILLAGTGLGVLLYLGEAGLRLEGLEITLVPITQMFVFAAAAARLMPETL